MKVGTWRRGSHETVIQLNAKLTQNNTVTMAIKTRWDWHLIGPYLTLAGGWSSLSTVMLMMLRLHPLLHQHMRLPVGDPPPTLFPPAETPDTHSFRGVWGCYYLPTFCIFICNQPPRSLFKVQKCLKLAQILFSDSTRLCKSLLSSLSLIQRHFERLSAELMHPSTSQSIKKQPQRGRSCDLIAWDKETLEMDKTSLIKKMIFKSEPPLHKQYV